MPSYYSIQFITLKSLGKYCQRMKFYCFAFFSFDAPPFTHNTIYYTKYHLFSMHTTQTNVTNNNNQPTVKNLYENTRASIPLPISV